jgi:hypothetical protein
MRDFVIVLFVQYIFPSHYSYKLMLPLCVDNAIAIVNLVLSVAPIEFISHVRSIPAMPLELEGYTFT